MMHVVPLPTGRELRTKKISTRITPKEVREALQRALRKKRNLTWDMFIDDVENELFGRERGL